MRKVNEYFSKYSKAPMPGRIPQADSTRLGFHTEASAKEWLISAFKPVETAQSLRRDNKIFRDISKTMAQFCVKTNKKHQKKSSIIF